MTQFPESLQEALADRYRLDRELGQGGMATVYLSRDLKHERDVALKVLHPELAATLGPERFEREIRTTAKLQHPHILPVLDSGEAAGRLWYTMPYVEGESLRDRLRREHQLPVEDALRITREVAEALGYAHSRGVVHRDIKPENILLSRGHALVADFGVAKAVGPSGPGNLTEAGTALGTPLYMSPEQSMGDRHLDGRSDLYSLGCVLYEMLAGEPPYTGPSAQAVIAKRLLDPIPAVRRLRETAPPVIDDVLERALAKVPGDRFATADLLVQALASAERSPRMGVPSHRRWRAWVGVAAGAGIAVATIMVYHRPPERTPRARDGAADTERLAVLPFENLGDSTDAYFADGMTDAVRDKLTSVPGLQVIAPISSGQYRLTSKPPARIGEELGVRYLLVGKVRWVKRAGTNTRVQIRPELIDASSGAERWGEAYDAALTDVFQLQADMASKVVGALRLRLSPEREHTVQLAPTGDIDAYDLYLKGRYYSFKPTKADRERGIGYFREAIQRDTTFALAYAGLSDGLALLTDFLPSSEIPPVREQSRAAALRSVALDSTLAEAYVALADLQYWFDWDWASAERNLRRAIALNPDDALAHRWLVDILTVYGRHAEAVAEAQKAERLDPINPVILYGSVVAHTMAREYAQAIPAVRRILELDSTSSTALSWLGLLELEIGHQADAVRDLQKAAGETRGDVRSLLPLAYCRAVLNQRADARRLLHQAEVMAHGRPVLTSQFAAVHAALGDQNAAFAWLERGLKVHDPGLIFLAIDPTFDVLRHDPRFSQLLHRAGLPVRGSILDLPEPSAQRESRRHVARS